LILLCCLAATAWHLPVDADEPVSADDPPAAGIDVDAIEEQLTKLILPLI